MLRLGVLFLTGMGLLGGLALGPTLLAPSRLSSIEAASVRVESIPKPRPRSRGVYVGGSRRSSGRYSSGGGFSSGK